MGFFSNLQFSSVKQYHYRGDFYHVPEFAHPNSANRLLMYTVVDKDGTNFPIFNTHFTWSVGGQVSDEQRQNFVKMELILDEFEEVILCGDFNTPRGKELYSKLAARYQDALPPEVKTTIDPVMHRGGALQLVVDGIFCSSHFEILSARTKYGVSDHQAIIVELQRKQA
jgi:endonuclease/exonuclease/phosphatase family metal-dependent hydrolase